jgi:hypothetical protein
MFMMICLTAAGLNVLFAENHYKDLFFNLEMNLVDKKCQRAFR